MVTLTYFLLPFAVLPIYGSLRAIREVTIEAARDLGAGPFAVMRDVILPQCGGGLTAAFMLSFLISVGDYVTPRFVGGGAAMMGNFIENQFSLGFNWPMGSAMAFTALACRCWWCWASGSCGWGSRHDGQRKVDLLWLGFSRLVCFSWSRRSCWWSSSASTARR